MKKTGSRTFRLMSAVAGKQTPLPKKVFLGRKRVVVLTQKTSFTRTATTARYKRIRVRATLQASVGGKRIMYETTV